MLINLAWFLIFSAIRPVKKLKAFWIEVVFSFWFIITCIIILILVIDLDYPLMEVETRFLWGFALIFSYGLMLLFGVLLMLVDIVERIVEIIKSLKNACKTRRKRAKVSPSEIKDINGQSPTSDKKPKFSFLDTSNDLWRPSAIEIKKGNARKIFVPKTSQTRYMYSPDSKETEADTFTPGLIFGKSDVEIRILRQAIISPTLLNRPCAENQMLTNSRGSILSIRMEEEDENCSIDEVRMDKD